MNIERKGKTLLHEAVENDNLDSVKFLVEKDADCNVRNRQGNTPLHIASQKGNPEIIKELMKLHPDLYIKNRSELRAMDLASDEQKALFYCNNP